MPVNTRVRNSSRTRADEARFHSLMKQFNSYYVGDTLIVTQRLGERKIKYVSYLAVVSQKEPRMIYVRRGSGTVGISVNSVVDGEFEIKKI